MVYRVKIDGQCPVKMTLPVPRPALGKARLRQPRAASPNQRSRRFASVLRQRYSFPTRQFTDTTLEETLEACC